MSVLLWLSPHLMLRPFRLFLRQLSLHLGSCCAKLAMVFYLWQGKTPSCVWCLRRKLFEVLMSKTLCFITVRTSYRKVCFLQWPMVVGIIILFLRWTTITDSSVVGFSSNRRVSRLHHVVVDKYFVPAFAAQLNTYGIPWDRCFRLVSRDSAPSDSPMRTNRKLSYFLYAHRAVKEKYSSFITKGILSVETAEARFQRCPL